MPYSSVAYVAFAEVALFLPVAVFAVWAFRDLSVASLDVAIVDLLMLYFLLVL